MNTAIRIFVPPEMNPPMKYRSYHVYSVTTLIGFLQMFVHDYSLNVVKRTQERMCGNNSVIFQTRSLRFLIDPNIQLL
jgi:hypothetical protein